MRPRVLVVATGATGEEDERPGDERVELAWVSPFVITPRYADLKLALGRLAEVRTITERMFLVAARALAAQVDDERLSDGALYPPIVSLSDIAREVAVVVAEEARAAGVAGVELATDLAALVEEAMWQPEYVPYIRSRAAVHRDEVLAAHEASIA